MDGSDTMGKELIRTKQDFHCKFANFRPILWLRGVGQPDSNKTLFPPFLGLIFVFFLPPVRLWAALHTDGSDTNTNTNTNKNKNTNKIQIQYRLRQTQIQIQIKNTIYALGSITHGRVRHSVMFGAALLSGLHT